VRTVRDPARSTAEGIRTIRVPGAEAEYEVAPLSADRWAVRVRMSYLCGNGSGRSVSWQEYQTREECIDFFVTAARHHFEAELSGHDPVVNDSQQRARRAILESFRIGLFGFVEPEPDPPA
jgi:hypothetical protein